LLWTSFGDVSRGRTRADNWAHASREADSNASFSERQGEVEWPTIQRFPPAELANPAKSSTQGLVVALDESYGRGASVDAGEDPAMSSTQQTSVEQIVGALKVM
jgi:hypothetical protein